MVETPVMDPWILDPVGLLLIPASIRLGGLISGSVMIRRAPDHLKRRALKVTLAGFYRNVRSSARQNDNRPLGKGLRLKSNPLKARVGFLPVWLGLARLAPFPKEVSTLYLWLGVVAVRSRAFFHRA